MFAKTRGSKISQVIDGAAARLAEPEVLGSHRLHEARRFVVPLTVLSLVGLSVGFLVYATTPLGAGVETDAVNYLSAAGSLSRGAGYLGWDGQLLPYFPPGYPLLLALLLLTGAGAQQVAQGADVVLFAGLVLATYALACRVIENPAIRLLAAAAAASSPILLGVYALISSETLFNFLCVAGLVVVCLLPTSAGHPGRYRAVFGLLVVITATAVLTRLAGVALVLSLAITILAVARPGQRFIVRACASLGFVVLVLAPITGWDIFLHSQTGEWTFGSRPAATSGIAAHVLTATQTLSGWVSLPSAMFPGWGWLDLLTAVVMLIALATALGELFRRPATHLRKVAPVLTFCLVYPIVMVLLTSRVDLADPLGDRYLSPLLAPLVVLAGFSIEMSWLNARRYGWLGRGLTTAMIGAVSLSLASGLVQSGRAAQHGHLEGIAGVTTANWTDMGVLRAARRLPANDGQLLFSNLPEMMTYSTRSFYQYPPNRGGGVSDDLLHQVKASGSAYLVVLTAFDDPSLYTPDELAQWFAVRVLYSGPDGQLVQLSVLTSPPGN